MVQWNTTSPQHDSGNISTCGVGLKFYEFRATGKHTHVSIDESTGANTYMISELNSDLISKAAWDKNVSEIEFSKTLSKNTHYVSKNDEILPSIGNVLNNDDNIYPFKPKTVIRSSKITNKELIDWFNVTENDVYVNIENLEKELVNKYYGEIKGGHITIYIKFPQDTVFRELASTATTDVIGTTLDHTNEHIIDIFYVENDFSMAKKSEYLIRIAGVFFNIKKCGSSYTRKSIDIKPSDMDNIFHMFSFQQYHLSSQEDKLLKAAITGKSLDAYCGVYLKFDNTLIDGRPIAAKLTERNLPGAKLYRGILHVKTPGKTKRILGIQGLKANFNLCSMQQLETTIKNCCTMYSNFYKKYPESHHDFKSIDPRKYCEVLTTNQKSQKKSIPGRMYLRLVGKNFWKLGMTKDTESKRILDILTPKEYQELKQTFPEEDILAPSLQRYELVTNPFNNCSSTEQALKEFIIQQHEIIAYDNKKGEDIREYFHCESEEMIKTIKQFIVNRLSEDSIVDI
jgi:hypothetical protein